MVTDNESGNSTQAEKPANVDSGDFFNELDQSVNGLVPDSEGANQANSGTPQQQEVQQPQKQAPIRKNNWQKRYKDSSREATKLSKQLSELKPFVPVLEAMKRDSGLVEHVRDYLKGGGAPNKSLKEKLGHDEDFIYDPNEAIDNPDSGSAKLQQAHVDELVNSRVNQVLAREKQAAQKTNTALIQKRQEMEFAKKHNMSKTDFENFKSQAQQRKLTLDDIYMLVNKDKSKTNIANNAKQDVLNQMKNVRDIPTTASDANNQGTSEKSPESKLFQSMMGLDGDVDNLFG